MLVDANILLYAVDRSSPFHEDSRALTETALNGTRRVGIAWMSLSAFLRISTNPRAMTDPLTPAAAWQVVEEWLEVPLVWTPTPGQGHKEILGRLIRELELRANLISDAVLAALCIEHGLEVISADSDFARFSEVHWHNPVAR